MAFQQFGFPEVAQELGLTLRDEELFRDVPAAPVRPEFATELTETSRLALGINTEKARSEFMIAPILLELHRLLKRSFGIFSGVELNADPNRGLNGVCDFLLTRSPMQIVLTPPILAVAEAKNDNIRNGYGQCIAAMVAAQILNDRAGQPTPVFGVSTTGTEWRFLRLDGAALTFDKGTYLIDSPGAILGVLKHIITAA